MTTRKYESGRSLVEMVGVLALMGLLTAAAFLLVRSGMMAQKVSRTADEINTLVANVRAIAAEKGDFSVLPDCQDEDESAGASLAAAILDSEDNSEAPAAIGGSYSLCSYDDDGDGVFEEFLVYIYDMNSYDCEMMESRAFSGGTAECSGTSLEIRYTK